MVQYGTTRLGIVWYGQAWYSMASSVMVHYSMVRNGTVWHDDTGGSTVISQSHGPGFWLYQTHRIPKEVWTQWTSVQLHVQNISSSSKMYILGWNLTAFNQRFVRISELQTRVAKGHFYYGWGCHNRALDIKRVWERLSIRAAGEAKWTVEPHCSTPHYIWLHCVRGPITYLVIYCMLKFQDDIIQKYKTE